MSQSEHSRQSAPAGRVLLVDDNEDLRRMLCVALQRARFEVIEATLLDLPRHLAVDPPDAVVVDLQRSEADGLATLVYLRERHALDHVPIVFLSGSDDDEFDRRALAAGADWVGLRPLGIIELRKRVAELIRLGRPPGPELRSKPRLAVSQLKPTG
jgi:two-component system, OmpR family, response regulator